MKPVLSFAALAVLLYFLAEGPSPAQASMNVAESFEHFEQKMKELADTMVSKVKNAFTKIQESDFSVKAREWFRENLEKIKGKVGSTFYK